MPTRTLGPEGGWIVMSHIVGRRKPSFIREARKGKPKETIFARWIWIVMSHIVGRRKTPFIREAGKRKPEEDNNIR